jgi:hypothetical protein
MAGSCLPVLGAVLIAPGLPKMQGHFASTPGATALVPGLATGLVTSTQQDGITIGIPLLGVLATTSSDLLTGLHTVLAVETTIVLTAAVLVALGLRSRRTDADAAVSAAAEVKALHAR